MYSTSLIANATVGLHTAQVKGKGGSSVEISQHRLRQQTRPQEHLALCWLVAVTACFLAVGVAGLFESEDSMPFLLSGVPGEGSGEVSGMEAMMADVQTEDASVAQEVVEPTVEITEVPPMTDVVDPVQDLPELTQALVTEDLFVVPSAPRVETALRPVDPVEPKPVTQPAPRRTRSSATASSGRATSGSGSQAGGSGGAGASGMAASAGKFVIPRPSYPSSLKALGVSGTVRLSIQVGMSGRPESVSIDSSSGSAALDEFAASWVRRNGRGPAGSPGRIIAPLTFVLR
jgi:TonB family protein